MHSQEVSSRTTPTDSKYGGATILQRVSHADLAQLYQTATNSAAPEYYDPALAITLPDWHALLGTRMFPYLARDQAAYEALKHEKLCVIDSTIAFMGGLDLCFGRCVAPGSSFGCGRRRPDGIPPSMPSSMILRKARSRFGQVKLKYNNLRTNEALMAM